MIGEQADFGTPQLDHPDRLPRAQQRYGEHRVDTEPSCHRGALGVLGLLALVIGQLDGASLEGGAPREGPAHQGDRELADRSQRDGTQVRGEPQLLSLREEDRGVTVRSPAFRSSTSRRKLPLVRGSSSRTPSLPCGHACPRISRWQSPSRTPSAGECRVRCWPSSAVSSTSRRVPFASILAPRRTTTRAKSISRQSSRRCSRCTLSASSSWANHWSSHVSLCGSFRTSRSPIMGSSERTSAKPG